MKVFTIEKKIFGFWNFFVKKGQAVAVSLVLGAVVFSILCHRKNQQTIDQIKASQHYQDISNHLVFGKPEDVSAVEKFIQINNNCYGALAALQLAKHFVKQDDFFKAEQKLIQVQSQTKDDNLLSQIKLRLARVQLQEKKLDYALKTLETIKSPGWIGLAQDIRGDVFLAKGDTKSARKAYSESIILNGSQAQKVLLRIKLNNLPN